MLCRRINKTYSEAKIIPPVAWWNEECEKEESRIQKTSIRPNIQNKIKIIPTSESQQKRNLLGMLERIYGTH